MNKYFFTFGSNHETKNNISLGQYYVVIEAPSEGFAREIMFNSRDGYWAFCYTEEEFNGQPEKYGLYRLSLEQVTLN